jgi:hypothetical protein
MSLVNEQFLFYDIDGAMREIVDILGEEFCKDGVLRR